MCPAAQLPYQSDAFVRHADRLGRRIGAHAVARLNGIRVEEEGKIGALMEDHRQPAGMVVVPVA